MKRSVFSLVNKLIMSFLAILGFACDPDPARVEYGMPTADFKINGTIVDEVTLDKLVNIQVIMRNVVSSSLNADTAYSDENGSYEVKLSDWPSANTYRVKYVDINGSIDGEYESIDSTVTFEDPEFINGQGNWYEGETQKKINIKLTPRSKK